MLLEATYTPTPLYVQTPAGPAASDALNGGIRYFQRQDYQNAIPLFEQVLDIDPTAIYAYYYIGESYRLMGEKREALAGFPRWDRQRFQFCSELSRSRADPPGDQSQSGHSCRSGPGDID